MMRNIYGILFFSAAVAFLSSCSTTKHLKEGEVLYTGADVTVNPDSAIQVSGQKDLRSTLEDKTRPEPNKKYSDLDTNFSSTTWPANLKNKKD
ncbi:hypothetical protein [Niabella ginsengisoli]|uniref:Lipoprotein n=1 Tax=Niabella ginsengisoli TaxID=522298 RepID=A0ABS9SM09_9BACT|nr:hypothetical protein [Niabella ginsengisoli]MCH5599415.1 hypothetical protein [Niabella ginsengisoli]